MEPYQNSSNHIKNLAAARTKALETKNKCHYCHEDVIASAGKRHENSCVYNPKNIVFCPECQSHVLIKKAKFCSQTCAAIYNNKLRSKESRQKQTNSIRAKFNTDVSEYSCLHCQKTSIIKKNTRGKFCSIRCQHDYNWEAVIKPSILNGKKNSKSKSVRKFLIERDGSQCSDCGITEWKGKPITMDVDHIDGDHRNCMPNNFRLLCPNCHRQTPTWGKTNPLRYGTTSLRYDPLAKSRK